MGSGGGRGIAQLRWSAGNRGGEGSQASGLRSGCSTFRSTPEPLHRTWQPARRLPPPQLRSVRIMVRLKQIPKTRIARCRSPSAIVNTEFVRLLGSLADRRIAESLDRRCADRRCVDRRCAPMPRRRYRSRESRLTDRRVVGACCSAVVVRGLVEPTAVGSVKFRPQACGDITISPFRSLRCVAMVCPTGM